MAPDEIKNELLKTTFRYWRAHLNVPVGEISHGEFAVMQVIHHFPKERPEEKGIGTARLAAEVHSSPPAVSRILNTLEEKGCIVRETDPDNRRRTRIILTEKGEKIRQRGCELSGDYFDRVFDRMGKDRMLQFLSMWKELVEIMENNEA